MIHKAITLKFVVPTVLFLALGISISAIYLPDKHLVPVDYSVAGSGEILNSSCRSITIPDDYLPLTGGL